MVRKINPHFSLVPLLNSVSDDWSLNVTWEAWQVISNKLEKNSFSKTLSALNQYRKFTENNISIILSCLSFTIVYFSPQCNLQRKDIQLTDKWLFDGKNHGENWQLNGGTGKQLQSLRLFNRVAMRRLFVFTLSIIWFI